MANLNYATAYSNALAQAYPYVLNFGDLYNTENDNRYRFVNAKTIEIPSISTSGRVDSNRDTIAVASRNYDNAWEPKTLTNQRKWSTLVHPMDVDQTNLVASIQNITQVFNEEQKFPEMDAYLVSKIYSDWTALGNQADTTALTVKNILDVIDNLMVEMDEASGTSQSVSTVLYETSVNSSYRLKTTATLYSKGNLTGTEYQYLPKTEIKVLSHYSATVDYVLCVKTGRKAYILAENLSATSSSGQTATNYKTKVGGTYRLKKNTTLNSNGTFSGTSYQYLAKTQIKVVKHYSSSVDYVYVVKTGRYAYVPVANFT